jgi:hypothetical protein
MVPSWKGLLGPGSEASDGWWAGSVVSPSQVGTGRTLGLCDSTPTFTAMCPGDLEGDGLWAQRRKQQ